MTNQEEQNKDLVWNFMMILNAAAQDTIDDGSSDLGKIYNMSGRRVSEYRLEQALRAIKVMNE